MAGLGWSDCGGKTVARFPAIYVLSKKIYIIFLPDALPASAANIVQGLVGRSFR